MRLFAALLPPPPALDELSDKLAELHALPGADRLRWMERTGWHVTLAFYGETDYAQADELRERLQRVATRRDGFALHFAGGGRFGDRVLWTGLAGNTRDLGRLADSARAAGRRAGLPMEDRRYRAHLSLARQGKRAEVDLRPYADRLAGWTGTEWPAHELALVRSHLPRSGEPGEQPRYETLAAAPLRRPGDPAGPPVS